MLGVLNSSGVFYSLWINSKNHFGTFIKLQSIFPTKYYWSMFKSNEGTRRNKTLLVISLTFGFLLISARPSGFGHCKVISTFRNVTVQGCTTTQPVPIGTCQGYCTSNTTAMLEPPYYQANCRCCKPVELQPLAVTLSCTDGSELLNYQMAVITACLCERCSHTPGVINPPGSGAFKPSERPTTGINSGSGSGSGEIEDENDVFDYMKALLTK